LAETTLVAQVKNLWKHHSCTQ